MKQKLFSLIFALALMWSTNVWAATYNLSFSWTEDKVPSSIPGTGAYYVFWYDSSGNGDEIMQITMNKGYVANGGYVTSNPAITFYLVYQNTYNYGNITLPEPGTYTVTTNKSTHGGMQIVDYGSVTRSGSSRKGYYNTFSYYSCGYYNDTWGTQYYGSSSLNSKAWYSSVSSGSSTFTSGSITITESTDGYPYISGTLTTADGNTVKVTIGTAPSYSAGTITAVPNNASYGSVTGTAGENAFVSGTNYAGGTSVSLTATPNSGYYFSQWSDGSTSNPYSFDVNGNKSVTAQFVAYSNGSSLGTKTWSCNNNSEGQSDVLQTISGVDIYNIYYTSNGYNPAIQVELLIPTGTRKLYSGYYGAPAGTYNVWYDNTAGAAQVPSHTSECLGSVQNGAVKSRYYDNSGNEYVFYSGTVTVEPGYAGLYYKFVGKVLRNNTLYDLTATIGTRNTSADEIGRNYTITDCLVKRTSTNNCFDICIYGNHPYTGTEGGVIQLKNVNLGSNTSIAGAHTFTASYSNCDNSGQWFAEEGYTSSNGTDYIDNPSGTITFTWVGTDGSGNPRYTIDISSCHGYYYNSSVISGGYCFNTRDEINQYGYTFSKTMSVRAQNSDGTSLTLTDATTYTVTYNKGSYGTGSAIANDTKTGGVNLTLSNSTYTRTGYTQTGWSINSNGSTKDYNLGGTYSTDADLDLYPYWEINKYTVTVNTNPSGYGTVRIGSGAEQAQVEIADVPHFSTFTTPSTGTIVINGNTVTATPATVAGYTYTFQNWTNALATVTDDMDVTANFTRSLIPYTITYNLNGGTNPVSPAPVTGYNVESATITLPTPTKEGYNFLGWYANSDLTTGGVVTTIPVGSYGNKEFWAKWEQKTYTVTIAKNENDWGAISATSVANVPYGTVITTGTGENANKVTINGTTVTATPATSDAQYTYAFSGWTNGAATVTDAMTVTANFTRTVNTYDITWKSEDDASTLETDNAQAFGTTTAYNGAVPTKSATGYTYTFDGWTTEPNGAGTFYANGETPAVGGAATYYAHFTGSANTHTLSWVANGGTLTGGTAAGTTAYGTVLTAPTATRAGYTFNGWSPSVPATMPDDNATYTAQWNRIEYTITYNELNDATNSNPTSYNVETETFTLANPGTRDGYVFAGWKDESDNTITQIAKGSTGNLTLTATWNVKSSNIELCEKCDNNHYNTFKTNYNGETVNVTYNRQFAEGRWSTMCLPFNLDLAAMITHKMSGCVYEFKYATGNANVGSGVNLYFSNAKSIEAGKCYIVNANAALAEKTSFVFSGVTIDLTKDNGADLSSPETPEASMAAYNALPGYKSEGTIELVGTLRNGILMGKAAGNTYMGLKDNKIYYPNISQGSTIWAYRGIFRSSEILDKESMQKMRIIVDGEDRGELIIDADGDILAPSDAQSRKFIRDGVLYIEREGVIYDAQGKRIK